ncbi:PREDICTED: dynactin-associated protein [Condylura cristata]|uniref:dynactin-associated protein n=1 Tax=Condylura cristata TaxID=143302 RepID=UPI0003344C11|nr:PREDICTED: dynactin-associated protein [Condylura cristata]
MHVNYLNNWSSPPPDANLKTEKIQPPEALQARRGSLQVEKALRLQWRESNDIKGNAGNEKDSSGSACTVESSRMDRKHGKYVVNVEHSESQPPSTCSNDQAVHSSACWCPHSDDITSDSTGVCLGPAVPSYSEYPHRELCDTEVKGSCCNNWSLWKVFLSCLLACVVTTAIGVLVIYLVNNRGNGNSSVVIQLPPNGGGPVIILPGTSSTASQPTVTSTSTEPATTAPESATTAIYAVSSTTVATSLTSTESTLKTARTTPSGTTAALSSAHAP